MRARLFGAVGVLGTALALGTLSGRGDLGGDAPRAYLAWGKQGGEAPGTFTKPRCVAVSPAGEIAVLDLTGRIQFFTPEGVYRHETRMPTTEKGRPQGMTFDKTGRLYVADTHYCRVVIFDPAGRVERMFGREGTAPGELYWPCAIAVAADGRIFTAEYGINQDRIQIWSSSGEFRSTFGTFGTAPGAFMRPMGIALVPDGRILVADAVNHRIQVFDPTGKLLAIWGRSGQGLGELSYPYDLTLDPAGRVLTVEYGNHRIQAFNLEGAPLAVWGSLPVLAADGTPGPGLCQPWGLAVATDHRIYITDTEDHRVIRMSLP